MRFKVAGNKKDIVAVVVKNAETTITISAGAPVFLAANGTNDGLAVTSAVSEAAASQTGFFGIATADIAPGALGEAQVFGFFDTARMLIATRSATSAVWASFVAGSIGAFCYPNTQTGSAAAAPDQSFQFTATSPVTSPQLVRLMQTFASITTQVSTGPGSGFSGFSFAGVSSDNTAGFTNVKVFVRAM